MADASVAIGFKGLDQTRRDFKKVANGLLQELNEASKEGADIVKEEAQNLSPVEQGILQAAIRAGAAAGRAYVRAGNARVPYAGPIHFGWRAHNIEPQPFLYDAADARRAEVLEKVDDKIARLIARSITGRLD